MHVFSNKKRGLVTRDDPGLMYLSSMKLPCLRGVLLSCESRFLLRIRFVSVEVPISNFF